LLLATDEIRSALEGGNLTTVEIRNLAIKCGMLTLRQHGVELVKKGLTTVEEVTRVSR
jgi:type II secretory ATPase GspE/PulE/Tfp pilus assembly ATPase PilB-like protein